jgi:hypothetical protein
VCHTPLLAEQRFHQLESETLAARMELQSLQRLRDDSVSHRDKLNAQLTTQVKASKQGNKQTNKQTHTNCLY